MSLAKILGNKPEDVLLPNESVRQDALNKLKSALDPVASKYSPLDAVYVDGLKADQVWVQVQMVLDGVAEKLLPKLSEYASKDAADEAASEDASEDAGADISGDESEDEDELESELENGIDVEQDSDEDENLIGEDFVDDYNELDEEDEPEPEDDEGEEKFDLGEFQQHVLRLEQEGSEDDGPEIDFNAEIEASDEDDDDDEMHYSDFFAAPRAAKTTKRTTFASESEDELAAGDSDNEAMESARKDLFDDDDDEVEDTEQLSKFEQQQRELSKQIEELEAENIGQKEWGMRGEAKAKDRPEDSLYTIQFDRSTKPAPAITEESTATLEDLIKTRIKKQQFDTVPRRSEATAPSSKHELPELSEQKSGKSLAELYEEDRMRAENPEYYAKQDSAAMDTAHSEIVSLYNSVARKLDALCSWAYTPKQAAPSLQVVTQGASIAMEEAQPGTLAPEDQLAPQEVFKSDAATPMANSEMSASMKRKRRRDKSLNKGNATAKRSKRLEGKESMFNTLKQGNVTMLDKRGEKRDMRGQKVKTGTQTAANMKL